MLVRGRDLQHQRLVLGLDAQDKELNRLVSLVHAAMHGVRGEILRAARLNLLRRPVCALECEVALDQASADNQRGKTIGPRRKFRSHQKQAEGELMVTPRVFFRSGESASRASDLAAASMSS